MLKNVLLALVVAVGAFAMIASLGELLWISETPGVGIVRVAYTHMALIFGGFLVFCGLLSLLYHGK